MHAPATLSAIAGRREIERRALMPTALHSFIQENGRVLVAHTFFGKTEAEAQKWKEHHLESCDYFRAAVKEGRTIEITEELDELPEPDVEDLELFLGFDLDDEEEDEEDEEDEEETEEEDE
jgi:hypothetical protein